jgi:neutral ceramidase
VPAYKVLPGPAPPHLLVGAASEDITPPPGFPMGGHSLAGRFSRGHWMRLRARAFYFRDTEGSSLALVSCDLYAIPAGLQQMVAASLHPKTGQSGKDVPDLSRDNLILTATHTHQSPGNYMSSEFYNEVASPYPGFSEELFKTLAKKIARAVARAAENAEKHPEGAALVVTTAAVPTLVRNRAIHAFARNDRTTVQDPILARGPLPPIKIDCQSEAPDHSDICLRYGAVDPEFTVLVARRRDGAIPAVLVFGAVHPTVLSHDVSFYSPDLVGVAMRELERGTVTWPREPDMVAGFFNGAEGDVSPRWVRRDIDEVKKLGRRLAESVGKAVDDSSSRLVEGGLVRIRAVRAVAGQYAFCKSWPTPGVGTLGGGEDGRFVSFDMGWRAPYRRPPAKKSWWGRRLLRSVLRWIRAPNQGVKQPGFELSGMPLIDITQVLAAPDTFPREVPVTVARLGSLTFLAVPAELTTAMGRQIREDLAKVLSGDRTIILGLANEYLEYVTTEAEYDEQDYEGSSTLFGPKTGQCYRDLLRGAAEKLKEGLSKPPPRREYRVPSAEFQPGPKPMLGATFGAEYWGLDAEYHDQELKSVFAAATRLEPDLWPRLEWREEGQDDESVKLLEKREDMWITEEDDDRAHPAVATFLSDGTQQRRAWDAYWFPDADHDSKAVHLFEVRLRNGALLCSEPFTIADIKTGRIRLPLKPSAAACPP